MGYRREGGGGGEGASLVLYVSLCGTLWLRQFQCKPYSKQQSVGLRGERRGGIRAGAYYSIHSFFGGGVAGGVLYLCCVMLLSV